MDFNTIISGVGGQGILSIAFVLDHAAVKEGLLFKQAEVHGMSQRGGAVQSHIRFSKDEIWSDIIPEGGADLILSMEPLETLRYLHYLKPGGFIVSSSSPFVNIPNYPDVEEVCNRIGELREHVLIDGEGLAKLAGSPKAQNMVMLGAASHLLPFQREVYLEYIELLFKGKNEKVMQANRNAFEYGDRVSRFYRAGLEAGIRPEGIRNLCRVIDPEEIEIDSVDRWKEAVEKHPDLFSGAPGDGERLPGTAAAAKTVFETGTI